MDYSIWLLLLLIPVCSQLNHLGGQSTSIPNPRITCRVFGIPAAVTGVAYLAGVDMLATLAMIYLAGMAIWAVFYWGVMFMTLNGEDHRDYSRFRWIAEMTDFIVNTHQYDILTQAQCKIWGAVWGTIRGGFRYPMYLALAYFFTPWAAVIGLLSFLQGFIYRRSSDVLHAEYKQGAMIGMEAAAILAIYLLSK